MSEESYIDSINKLSRETGLKYYTNTSQKDFPLIASDRFSKSEYVIFDEIGSHGDIYLVFADQLSARVGSSYSYCGLYRKLRTCDNEISIRKKYFIDRIIPAKKFKSESSYVNSKVVIFAESYANLPVNVNESVIGDFIELTKTIPTLKITTLRDSMSFIPLLNGASWVSLTIDRKWELDVDKLKLLISKGSMMLEKLVPDGEGRRPS